MFDAGGGPAGRDDLDFHPAAAVAAEPGRLQFQRRAARVVGGRPVEGPTAAGADREAHRVGHSVAESALTGIFSSCSS